MGFAFGSTLNRSCLTSVSVSFSLFTTEIITSYFIPNMHVFSQLKVLHTGVDVQLLARRSANGSSFSAVYHISIRRSNRRHLRFNEVDKGTHRVLHGYKDRNFNLKNSVPRVFIFFLKWHGFHFSPLNCNSF